MEEKKEEAPKLAEIKEENGFYVIYDTEGRKLPDAAFTDIRKAVQFGMATLGVKEIMTPKPKIEEKARLRNVAVGQIVQAPAPISLPVEKKDLAPRKAISSEEKKHLIDHASYINDTEKQKEFMSYFSKMAIEKDCKIIEVSSGRVHKDRKKLVLIRRSTGKPIAWFGATRTSWTYKEGSRIKLPQ